MPDEWDEALKRVQSSGSDPWQEAANNVARSSKPVVSGVLASMKAGAAGAQSQPVQDVTPTFKVPKGGIRMGLAGSGRGSETQQPAPDVMQVGPVQHGPQGTTIPGKLTGPRTSLETDVENMPLSPQKRLAQAALGTLATMGFGTAPTPEKFLFQTSLPLLGALGPTRAMLAGTGLGLGIQAPNIAEDVRAGNYPALGTDVLLGAIPAVAHGAMKGLSKLRPPAQEPPPATTEPAAPSQSPMSPETPQAPPPNILTDSQGRRYVQTGVGKNGKPTFRPLKEGENATLQTQQVQGAGD